MRVIAHLSDLHFGRARPVVAEALLADLRALSADLIVVSGDWTQRARSRQFETARAFLRVLPRPPLTIPGNHDMPLYDLPRRLLSPLGRYRSTIAAGLCPFFADDEVAVLALSTANPAVWREGRVSAAQVALVRERLGAAPAAATRVLVTHHPLAGPAAVERGSRVAGREPALAAAAAAGVDVFLAGHTHAERAAAARLDAGRRGASSGGPSASVIAIEAGTATSSRTRGAGDSYNVLSIWADVIELEVRTFRASAFGTTTRMRFERGPGGWSPA